MVRRQQVVGTRRRPALAGARKAAGHTQESLAAALHVDRSTVIRWEAGDHAPLPYLRPKLARLLDQSPEQLQELIENDSDIRPTDGDASLDIQEAFDWLDRHAGWSPGTSLRKVMSRLRAPDERVFYDRSGRRVDAGLSDVAQALLDYCLTFERTASELFGELGSGVPAGTICAARSHKFIPVFVGAEAVLALAATGQWSHIDDQWMDCQRRAVEHPTGSCQLYLWPFGVAVFHLVEDLALESVAHLAVWRRISYEQNMQWAHDQLQALAGSDISEQPYVLSLYWVDEPAWRGNDLPTALRLMCIPRVLVTRAQRIDESCLASAALVERALLESGFEHPELVDFSMKGISLGYASWSGVVYYPIAQDRALREHELITCELSVQAAWAYCDYLRQQVERGDDPVVPAAFGWRFLRGIHSRLTTERPQETSQHRSMRDAVVQTSGLDRHLAQAVDILRDCDRT